MPALNCGKGPARDRFKMNERIASFSVDHDFIVPGMYISRIDGDVTTYDLRTRKPNAGDYMDNVTMHTVEHMMATFLRNSAIAKDVIYFGPMGCRTGFYLLVRGSDHENVRREVIKALKKTAAYEGKVFGQSRKECGNYRSLRLSAAKKECGEYAKILEKQAKNGAGFDYPEAR